MIRGSLVQYFYSMNGRIQCKALSTQFPNTAYRLSRPVECNLISYPIIQKSQQSVEGRLFYKNVMSVFTLQIKLIMN